jgi:hypothetical protein
MQGTEVPVGFPLKFSELLALLAPWSDQDDDERAERPRTGDAPPLRYEVASLEHWLDLNA